MHLHEDLKSDHQKRIERMMRLASQELPCTPTMPSAEVRLLRVRLILEEAMEFAEACGVTVQHREVNRPMAFHHLEFNALAVVPAQQLVDAVDGLGDLSVVTIGSLSAFGVPDMPVLEEVDENNLKKFGPGGFKDMHGKWVKPPGHTPPDLAGVLVALGWCATPAIGNTVGNAAALGRVDLPA